VFKRESPLLLILQKRQEKLCKEIFVFFNEEAASVGTAAGFRMFESWTAG
jgi:hypothetical protein